MFEIPEDLRGEKREYAAVRVHNGQTAFLSDLDDDDDTITIQTDKFSTYTIIYKDLKTENNDDTSGDSTSNDTSSSTTSGDSTSGDSTSDDTGSSTSDDTSSSSSDDGNTTSDGGNTGDPQNPYTGTSAMAVCVLAVSGALAAVLVRNSKDKK